MLLASLCVSLATPCFAQGSTKDVVAAHLRMQGYKCDTPKSAARDAAASRPDEAVWIIRCENARYRVRLIPDMAAIVEPF
ncbi:hypothetical protein JMJ47_002284 [Methylocystis sp. MJC1]|nr:hypothetical protein [Methylocystis sp. MJC1]